MKSIIKTSKFFILLLIRFILLLITGKYNIKKIRFSCSENYIFSRSKFIINYEFTNILYYKVSGRIVHFNSNCVSVDLEVYKYKQIEFVAIGIFQSQKIIIPINVKAELVPIIIKPFQNSEIEVGDLIKNLVLSFKVVKPSNRKLNLTKSIIQIKHPLNFQLNDLI